MSKKLSLKLFVLLPLAALMLSGCTFSFGTSSGTTSANLSDGGVYKSVNKGLNWAQKSLIQTVGSKKGFSSIDIISLGFDPSDNKAIYAGSSENGLFYSYDSGESWQVATSLGKVTVTNIAVDPANKCLIYATANNKVFKSEDCSRTWNQVYYDNDPKTIINSLVIEHADSKNVFIGTSNGDVIKSSDKGASWRALDRFNSEVHKIVINPINSKIMFAGTKAKGIFRSANGGETWESLSGKLENFDGSNRFRDLTISGANTAVVFLATNYGLLKSTDNGDTWSKIQLLTAEAEAKIYSIAVNSSNVDEIYYATGTTFYRSLDGGKNWSSKKLPTTRVGYKLLLDFKNPAIVYLAANKIKK